MGSAAPSPRRWIAVLALVAGAGGVALLLIPGTDADRGLAGDEPAGDELTSGQVAGLSPDRSGSRAGTTPVDAQMAPVETITVQPEFGWSIPAPIEESADAGANEDDHDGTVGQAAPDRLTPGADTTGASVAAGPTASTMVVHSPVVRELAYRIETDDGFQPWRALPLGDHEAPDGLPGEEGSNPAPPAALPILLPPGSIRIEFVDRAAGVQPFDVIFLPSFDSPVRPEFDAPAAPAAAGAGMPEIRPREAWTSAGWATENGSCQDGPQVSPHLQAVVVHHTVTSNGYSADQVDDLLRSIHYSHTVINGWCDIGYNFVVDRFGQIWEARTGSIERSVIGGHARGFNTGTLGVALLGQHQDGAWPSVAAVNQAAQGAVESLAQWRLGAEGVDPHGRTWLRNRSSASRQRLAAEAWHYVPTVLGHRDLGLTSCPGSYGMNLVAALPDRLASRRVTGLPYSWPAWQAHDHGPAFVVADTGGGVRPAGSARPWTDAPAVGDIDGPVIAVGGDPGGGYLLTSAGSLIRYGDAPALPPTGFSGPIDLEVRADGASGWVLDQAGTLRGFGGAGDRSPSTAVQEPVAFSVDDGGRGYILERSGRLVPVGDLDQTRVSLAPGASAVDLVLDGPGVGWVLEGSGRLLGFGGRPDRQVTPAATPVAVAAGATEPGGWVLDREGQLWPFGGARYVFPVATDARVGAAVDLDGIGLIYREEFLSSGDARFVQRLHRTFLGRDATNAEIDLGVTSLEQGSDRIDLVEPLVRSEQWVGSALDQMYRDVLGREPDPEGRAYWMGEIERGLELHDLGIYFYGSVEYARSAGSHTAYVRRLYESLLHRAPDDEGLAYWTDELASGRALPPDIAAGFYVSVESRRDRASRLVQRILGSTPTAEERDALAGRLAQLGDVGLAADLAASSDFYDLASAGPDR